MNGLGSGTTSPSSVTMPVPGPLALAYQTQDSLAPVFLGIATVSTVGWITTPTNSVDVGPIGLALPLNGLDFANPLSPFLVTNPSGLFSLTLFAPGALAGQTRDVAMGHASATSPDGFFISQTHHLGFSLDPNLSPSSPGCTPGTPITLTDDSFMMVSLGFNAPFYGTAYADAYIGSNGYITFGQGDTSYTPTVAYLLSGPPRISMLWNDLNPAIPGGSVTFFTDSAFSAEVCFNNVSEYASNNSNTVRCSFGATGNITFDYGALATLDAMVGLTPGNNVDPIGYPLNLSVGPNAIPSGSAPYEYFTFTAPQDVAGYQVTFILDALGSPVVQF